MPLQIGITGGIGSGKSVVCRIFEALGVAVYDADSRAKWLTNNDIALKNELVKLFGTTVYLPDGTYNRPWVAAQVFNNEALLKQLNTLIHPRVFEDAAAWLGQHQTAKYLVRESALATKATDLDQLVVVHAPLAMRIARIKQRDPQRSEAEINNIIARQMPDEERLRMADFVIQNDERQLLIEQVLHLHEVFSKR